jgi:hypothetical protein
LLSSWLESQTARTFFTAPTDSGGTLNTFLPNKLINHMKEKKSNLVNKQHILVCKDLDTMLLEQIWSGQASGVTSSSSSSSYL